jgi:hypothetical protein
MRELRGREGRGCEVVLGSGGLTDSVVLFGWAKSEDGGDDGELDW